MTGRHHPTEETAGRQPAEPRPAPRLSTKVVWLLVKELRRGWVSAVLIVIVVAVLTGALTFVAASGVGLQREITRSVRDLGSNVVILPSSVDQLQYHLNGGFSDTTMPMAIVDKLVDRRASLNHLVPMLERQADVSFQERTLPARVVGLSASIPIPGRPKAPMQRAIDAGKVQLGSAIAAQLEIDRETPTAVEIAGTTFPVQRVNRSTGSWQDGAVLMELERAQALFELPGRISRIEAVECTSEKCALTGQLPSVVLQNELAEIGDQAILLRRDAIADGRRGVRSLTRDTLRIANNALWIMLIGAVCGLTALNTYWRRAEIGLLGAIGYGPWHVLWLFVGRTAVLALLGAGLGACLATALVYRSVPALLAKTGTSFAVSGTATMQIVLFSVLLATLAACLPGWWAVNQQPADILGENG